MTSPGHIMWPVSVVSVAALTPWLMWSRHWYLSFASFDVTPWNRCFMQLVLNVIHPVLHWHCSWSITRFPLINISFLTYVDTSCPFQMDFRNPVAVNCHYIPVVSDSLCTSNSAVWVIGWLGDWLILLFFSTQLLRNYRWNLTVQMQLQMSTYLLSDRSIAGQ